MAELEVCFPPRYSLPEIIGFWLTNYQKFGLEKVSWPILDDFDLEERMTRAIELNENRELRPWDLFSLNDKPICIQFEELFNGFLVVTLYQSEIDSVSAFLKIFNTWLLTAARITPWEVILADEEILLNFCGCGEEMGALQLAKNIRFNCRYGERCLIGLHQEFCANLERFGQVLRRRYGMKIDKTQHFLVFDFGW